MLCDWEVVECDCTELIAEGRAHRRAESQTPRSVSGNPGVELQCGPSRADGFLEKSREKAEETWRPQSGLDKLVASPFGTSEECVEGS